jgi:hypothetical protein
MSQPAQNDLPTARMTSAPTSGLPSTSSNVEISSSAIAGASALRPVRCVQRHDRDAAVHLKQHLNGSGHEPTFLPSRAAAAPMPDNT